MKNFRNKPVIIHLVNSNIFSGLEKVAIDIIENLKDKYDFYYACKDGPIEEVLKEKKIKRIQIKEISKKEILRIEKIYKPNIIHAHDYKATLFCGLFIKNTKIISHLHNNSPWIKEILHPYNYIFLKACLNPLMEKIFVVSKSIENEYIFSKFIKDKIQVIGNPISISNVINGINLNADKVYDVCFVGRLTKQKNPIRFIKIINLLKEKIPNIKAIIIGDGELKDSCMRKIEKLKLQENIKLLGFIKEPYKEMAKSKVFCLTSDWEGFGLVVFEALALGLPCVVSGVGGIVDIVDDKSSFLCTSDADFEKYISELLHLDKENYNKKSFSAIKRAKEIENVKEYIKIIDDTYYIKK